VAIALLFTPAALDAGQYDEIIARLKQAGMFPAPGMISHVCFGSGNKLRVFDVWESQETFNEFGKTLLPILQELGVESGQPEVNEVHNTLHVKEPVKK
jgi:hypothetical protein